MGIFRRIFIPLVFVIFSFQIGCASKGFNRGELKEQIGVIKPTFSDDEIKTAYKKKANLPKPFKLAVYFKTPDLREEPRSHGDGLSKIRI